MEPERVRAPRGERGAHWELDRSRQFLHRWRGHRQDAGLPSDIEKAGRKCGCDPRGRGCQVEGVNAGDGRGRSRGGPHLSQFTTPNTDYDLSTRKFRAFIETSPPPI